MQAPVRRPPGIGPLLRFDAAQDRPSASEPDIADSPSWIAFRFVERSATTSAHDRVPQRQAVRLNGDRMLYALISLLVVVAIVLFLVKVAVAGGIIGAIALVLLVLAARPALNVDLIV